ncbi:MAG: hypothetical protein K1X78_24475 [Verrucomicrobiaceae bacterium]|nr:hypothetical protein [Verrucomicrobiaceae bacterium]
MKINFDKAHKLISTLEDKLNSTSQQTSHARQVLDEWRQSGEKKLRKKTAQALKLVRKKADSFAKALTHLEENLAKSLDRVAEAIEKPAPKARPKAGATARKTARKSAAAAPGPSASDA